MKYFKNPTRGFQNITVKNVVGGNMDRRHESSEPAVYYPHKVCGGIKSDICTI